MQIEDKISVRVEYMRENFERIVSDANTSIDVEKLIDFTWFISEHRDTHSDLRFFAKIDGEDVNRTFHLTDVPNNQIIV